MTLIGSILTFSGYDLLSAQSILPFQVISVIFKTLLLVGVHFIHLVFQEYNLSDTLTVYENIALALTIKRIPKETVKQAILDLADKLGISEIPNNFPFKQYCRLGRDMQAGFQTMALPLLIVMIMAVLVNYINHFIIRQRAKEFATYMLTNVSMRFLIL